jgi:hypothetical protein
MQAFKRLNSITMNSMQDCRSGVRSANERDHEVRVNYEEVFRWLDALENLSASEQEDFDLEQLRSELEDACWLADWKREYVLLDESRVPVVELNKMSAKP